MGRPTVGVFGLTGCAGDQLAVLNCEDELLQLVDLLDIRDFLMAASAPDEECRLDIAFVEGAVLSARDEATLRTIRARSNTLVALGTCAVWGGIPALDRHMDRAELQRDIYGDGADGYDSIPARALHEVVPVDLGITGCPIEKDEFLGAVAHLLHGDPPPPRDRAVCSECRVQENACLLFERAAVCCGPFTAGGCHARCVAYGIPCAGCRGPVAHANIPSGIATLEVAGASREEVISRLRTFAPGAATIQPRSTS
jgi:sulfhydrogenase subunit delta